MRRAYRRARNLAHASGWSADRYEGAPELAAVSHFRLVDAETLESVPATFTGAARLLVAAYAGTTRLIDNVAVNLGTLVG